MLHLYYKWRYRRAQRAEAFELPNAGHSNKPERTRFGSYLSQQSVRGKPSSPLDQSRKRRKWLRCFVIIGLTLALGWVIYESVQEIRAWND